MQRAIYYLLTFVFVFASIFVPSKVQAFDTNNVHQLVPLYVYPDIGVMGSVWERACSNLETSENGSIIILNPDSDKGFNNWNADWDEAVEYCQNQGHQVVGYVRTAYANTNPSGAAPLTGATGVLAAIDAWYDRTNVDGIFLDEVTGNYNSTAQDYYIQATDQIHEDGAPSNQDLAICNPGTAATTSWHLESDGDNGAGCDVVVVYEGTDVTLDSTTFPSWVAAKAGDELVGLVHSTYNTSDMQDACSDLKTAGIAWAYVSPNYDNNGAPVSSGGTAWIGFPGSTYWSAERNDSTGCG